MEVYALRKELYDYVILEFHFKIAALNMTYERPDRPILCFKNHKIFIYSVGIFVENILYSKKTALKLKTVKLTHDDLKRATRQ